MPWWAGIGEGSEPSGRSLHPAVWDDNSWHDYLWWQAQDRKILRRIDALIQDIARHGNEGIGKPEPLKYGFQGYWSRRISDEHRLIHKISGDEIRIAQCRYHHE